MAATFRADANAKSRAHGAGTAVSEPMQQGTVDKRMHDLRYCRPCALVNSTLDPREI